MNIVLYIIYLLAIPAMVMYVARWWKWIDRVSPMAVLYVIGLAVANFTPWIQSNNLLEINNTLGSVCIPLAIPLMLMACNLSNWSTGKALKSFCCGLIAIVLSIIGGFFIFRGSASAEHFAQICAVAVGIYTGGIPNMGAIAQGVGMDSETYLYITSYDLVITGLYLVFVILLGRPVFRKLLPTTANYSTGTPTPIPASKNNDAATPRFRTILLPMATTLAIAGTSFAISTLFSPDASTPMLILVLTTLSIGASRLPFIRNINRQYDNAGQQTPSFSLGLYFVYVFCFSIANGCNVREMDFAGSLNILWFILFVIFGSLLLQILFARILHLDGDSTLVASVALINSPPFVPLVAALCNNRNLIVLGISIGLLGYMLGNYLGLAIFYLLRF